MPLEGVCCVFFWHTQINCYAGAVGLLAWTGDDSWSVAAQVIHTAYSNQSFHHASDPWEEWA